MTNLLHQGGMFLQVKPNHMIICLNSFSFEDFEMQLLNAENLHTFLLLSEIEFGT